jgi:hypothetical protein
MLQKGYQLAVSFPPIISHSLTSHFTVSRSQHVPLPSSPSASLCVPHLSPFLPSSPSSPAMSKFLVCGFLVLLFVVACSGQQAQVTTPASADCTIQDSGANAICLGSQLGVATKSLTLAQVSHLLTYTTWPCFHSLLMSYSLLLV